jgi:hypothetical protein
MFVFIFRVCIPLRRGLEDAPGVRPYWVNWLLVDVYGWTDCSLMVRSLMVRSWTDRSCLFRSWTFILIHIPLQNRLWRVFCLVILWFLLFYLSYEGYEGFLIFLFRRWFLVWRGCRALLVTILITRRSEGVAYFAKGLLCSPDMKGLGVKGRCCYCENIGQSRRRFWKMGEL